MRIDELLANKRPVFSVELFPPKTETGLELLFETVEALKPLEPDYVSVTYGAGGSTRDKTREIVEHIHRDTAMTPMPHLTCVAHTRSEVTDIVEGYRDAGLGNILALGGDLPADGSNPPSDFRYAAELIELVREVGDFSVGVAAFPELHPRSAGDRKADRRHLAAKLRQADFGITQFFFRAADYFEMVDELAALDVDTPVIPGIIPVTNVGQVERFAALAGSALPEELVARLRAVADQPDEVRRIGVDVATALTAELLEGGAPGVHLYTLNFARATREICENLGLAAAGRPAP